MDSPPRHLLDYSARRTWREHWLAQRWQATPTVIIALALYLALWIVDRKLLRASNTYDLSFGKVVPCLYSVLLCVPGALRRLNGRQLLIMAGVGVGLYILNLKIGQLPQVLPFLYSWLVWPILAMLPIGIAEALLASPKKWRAAFWSLPLSLAGASLVSMFDQILTFSCKAPELSWLNYHGDESWGDVIRRPLAIAFAWVFVAISQKLPLPNWRLARLAAIAGLVSTFTTLIFYSHIFVYSLANRSLAGSGPFRREPAVEILNIRNSPADQEALWRVVENADWSDSEGYMWSDYRYAAIHLLAKHDLAGTAQRLTRLLAAKPSNLLAEESADVLANAGALDSFPTLLRYALLDDSECLKAVEKMKAPQAILAILRREAVYGFWSTSQKDFQLSASAHQRLLKIGQRDPGPNIRDWTQFYDENMHNLPTPLSRRQADEADRVAEAFSKYWRATQKLEDAENALFLERLNDDRRIDILREIERIKPLMDRPSLPSDADLQAIGASPALMNDAQRYLENARTDMAVAPPDWDAPGADGLEREINQYCQRVAEVIRRFSSAESGSAPSTRP